MKELLRARLYVSVSAVVQRRIPPLATHSAVVAQQNTESRRGTLLPAAGNAKSTRGLCAQGRWWRRLPRVPVATIATQFRISRGVILGTSARRSPARDVMANSVAWSASIFGRHRDALHHAPAPAVFDHSRTLPQGKGLPGQRTQAAR